MSPNGNLLAIGSLSDAKTQRGEALIVHNLSNGMVELWDVIQRKLLWSRTDQCDIPLVAFSTLDLQYADKDVVDLAHVFEGMKGEAFNDVHVYTYLNEEV